MSDLFGLNRPLPILSYWQPWASLHVAGLKLHETRHWPTRVRGPVAIHAAKKLDRGDAPEDLCMFAWGDRWWEGMRLGCVVAVAELTGCHRTEDLVGKITEADERAGNYAPGRYAFRMERVRALREPIPLIGRQGFFSWTPPADLEDQLLDPLDHIEVCDRWEAAFL